MSVFTRKATANIHNNPLCNIFHRVFFPVLEPFVCLCSASLPTVSYGALIRSHLIDVVVKLKFVIILILIFTSFYCKFDIVNLSAKKQSCCHLKKNN